MSNESLRKILEKLFFQVNYTCNNCGVEIFNGGYFCSDCEKIITEIKSNKCDHCGRVTFYPVNYCDSCIEKNINFDKARSVYDYVYPINGLIKSFKYSGKRYLAEVFASKLKTLYLSEFETADAIVFVPMTEERLEERGYNQAELLANELSSLIGIPVLPNALKKTRETPRQANLTKAERRSNLQKSFTAYASEIKGKSLLLVDDVLTTGATADIIAGLLKKKGATKVTVYTVASVQNESLKNDNETLVSESNDGNGEFLQETNRNANINTGSDFDDEIEF